MDCRMKLCMNWGKRMKLMTCSVWACIGILLPSYPIVCRLCELYEKWLGPVRFDLPPTEEVHARCEKVLFGWAILILVVVYWVEMLSVLKACHLCLWVDNIVVFELHIRSCSLDNIVTTFTKMLMISAYHVIDASEMEEFQRGKSFR